MATINRLLTSARVRKLPLTTADTLFEFDVEAWYELARQGRKLFALEQHVLAHVPRKFGRELAIFQLRWKGVLRNILDRRSKLNTEWNWRICVDYLMRTAREAHKA